MSEYACKVIPNEYDAYDCAYCNNFECDSHKKCFKMFFGVVVNIVDNIKNDGLNISNDELLLFAGYYELFTNIRLYTDIKICIKRFKTLIHDIKVDDKLSNEIKPYLIEKLNNMFCDYIEYRSDKMNNDNKNNKNVINSIMKLDDEKMNINIMDLKVLVSYVVRSSDYKSITFDNKTKGIKLFKTLIHDIEVDDRFSDEEIKKYCIVCCNRAFDVVGE